VTLAVITVWMIAAGGPWWSDAPPRTPADVDHRVGRRGRSAA